MAEVFYANASETATVANTFTVDGVATDPSTITFIVTDPDGTATSYTYGAAEITRSSAGVYSKDIACTSAGRWQAVIVGTGAAADVTVVAWDVVATSTATLYCSVELLKNRLAITDTTHDVELLQVCTTAAREVDEWCNRYFWKATATRTFVACSQYEVEVGDLVSVTTLKTDASGDGTFETTWSATDYQLRPVDAAYRAEQRPFTSLRAIANNLFPLYPGVGRDDRVQVVGVFGWPAVPAAVQQATAVLAAELLKLKDAPFGVAGFGEFGAVRIRNNPKAMGLLGPYRRRPVLVG